MSYSKHTMQLSARLRELGEFSKVSDDYEKGRAWVRSQLDMIEETLRDYAEKKARERGE